MEAVVEKRLISVDEYYKMAEVGILTREDKVELINGEIIKKMSPLGSKHAWIVTSLNELLNKQLLGKVYIAIQNPVRLHNFSEPEPDVAVLKPHSSKYREHHPSPEDVLLIIEVASSSLAYDEEIKSSLYAASGIPEYWVIDVEEERVLQFLNPASDSYLIKKEFSKNDLVKAVSIDFQLNMTQLFS